MFSAFGTGIKKEISSMPGIYQQSIEHIVEEARGMNWAFCGAPLRHTREKDARRKRCLFRTRHHPETIRALKNKSRGWR
jgi:porphobilinogen synthase